MAETPHDATPPVDPHWLARMREKKPEFLRALFANFLQEEPRRLAALEAAVAAGDIETTRFLAHSLKGAAATLGMEPLRDACRELEFAARDAARDICATALEAVRRELARVFELLKSLDNEAARP